MNKVYLAPGIYYIENVLNESELKTINDFYDEKHEEFEIVGNFYHYFNYLPEDIGDLYIKMDNILTDSIDLTKSHSHFSKSMQLYRTDNGVDEWAIGPHSDKYDYDANGREVNSRGVVFGYIFYFNDNYEGGEIVYVNKDISFKPKAGMLLIHDGSSEYKHGVKRVTSGERRFCTGFTFENGFCKDHN